MRVLCNSLDSNDIEGEVIGGERWDEKSGAFDLKRIFTLRCDSGVILQVHGWLVNVTVLDRQQG